MEQVRTITFALPGWVSFVNRRGHRESFQTALASLQRYGPLWKMMKQVGCTITAVQLVVEWNLKDERGCLGFQLRDFLKEMAGACVLGNVVYAPNVTDDVVELVLDLCEQMPGLRELNLNGRLSFDSKCAVLARTRPDVVVNYLSC